MPEPNKEKLIFFVVVVLQNNMLLLMLLLHLFTSSMCLCVHGKACMNGCVFMPSSLMSAPLSLCPSVFVCVCAYCACPYLSLPTCRDVIPQGAVTASAY